MRATAIKRRQLTDRIVKAWLYVGNFVAETMLWRQMFPSLAARKRCVAETNFAARKQKNVFKKMYSKTFLRPKHMFPGLATTENNVD